MNLDVIKLEVTNLDAESMLFELVIKIDETKKVAHGREHAFTNMVSDKSGRALEKHFVRFRDSRYEEQRGRQREQ
jgi:hypothetical protein